MFEVPGRVSKSVLSHVASLRGMVNSESVRINDVEYEPRSIVFVCFRGTHPVDGIFDGVFVYDDEPTGEEPICYALFPDRDMLGEQPNGDIESE